MRRIILFGLFILTAFGAFGQSPKEVVASMKGKLDGYGCVSIGFVFTARNAAEEVLAEETGSFVAQGEMFVMETSAMKVYCDGVSKWIYDIGNDEVTILNHDASSTDISENPFGVLRKMDVSEYNLQMKTKGVIVMKPKDKKANYVAIELVVDIPSYLPSSIKYWNKSSDTYQAKINSIEAVTAKPDSFYLPESSVMESVFVNDLR